MFKILKYEINQNDSLNHKEIIDYGVQLLGAPLEWYETKGKGVKVGVIDTGVDVYHEDLKDRVEEYINFTDEGTLEDLSGHGTHVCGIIAASLNGIGVVGVAPECSLYVAKAFKSDGTGSNKAISDSIEWLIQKNVQIINMSFASANQSPIIQEKLRKAYSKGITLIAAAGNEGVSKDSIGYPAKMNEVIAVTAIDFDKNFASFSSFGKEAQLAAAGNEIYSTFPNNRYVTLSGTSMAAPLISGAAALIQGKSINRFQRFLTPQEMKIVLCMYADDYGETGKDDRYGHGIFSFGRIN